MGCEGVYHGGETPASDPPIPPVFVRTPLLRMRVWPGGITFFVPGKPQQQGSKTKTRWGALREDNEQLGPWRERVALAAHAAANGRRFERGTPVAVGIEFVLYRPAALKLKATPPATKQPDIDKLERAVNDALTHVLWEDDAQVVVVLKRKRVAEPGESPGAHIWVGQA